MPDLDIQIVEAATPLQPEVRRRLERHEQARVLQLIRQGGVLIGADGEGENLSGGTLYPFSERINRFPDIDSLDVEPAPRDRRAIDIQQPQPPLGP